MDGPHFNQQFLEAVRSLDSVRMQNFQPEDQQPGGLREKNTERSPAIHSCSASNSWTAQVQRLLSAPQNFVARRRPVDERALEAGSCAWPGPGYSSSIRKEKIRVQLDEPPTLRRIVHPGDMASSALLGGRHRSIRRQAGRCLHRLRTCSIRRELLSAQLEGGPEIFRVLLGIAKER